MAKKKIAEFQDGDGISGFYLIRSSVVKVSNAGKRYMDIILCDNSGEINAKLWDLNNINEEQYESGAVVGVAGNILQWQNMLQLKISKIRLKSPDDDVNLVELVISAPLDEREMLEEVAGYTDAIQNEDIKKIVKFFMSEYFDKLLFYPAAKKNHHAIRSGLLYHIVRMLRLGEKTCDVYDEIDKDVLYAGIILHDMEKINEMDANELGIVSEYTKEGRLLGHIVMGISRIKEAALKLGIDGEVITVLQHMVLTHHYEADYGSPKKPMIPEAEILHYLDMIDARMYDMQKNLKPLNPGEFSKPVFSMDKRVIYKTTI